MKCLPAMLAGSIMVSSTVWSSAPNWQDETKWQNWPTVGKSSMSWLFLNIFKSELKTPSGQYVDSHTISPQPLALSIVYQRDISKKQLIDATKEQWLNLGYDRSTQQRWLIELESVYTSVKQGEKLVYVTDGLHGEFHFYQQGHKVKKLGEINSESLNNAFLSIWLSPATDYPSHREKLLGLKK